MWARALFLSGVLFLCIDSVCADQVIWSGEVKSDGTPTNSIPLTLRERYQIQVSKVINVGKWIQAREQLANDACFEFNKEKFTEKVESFKNSQNISVCDGAYHPDHVYRSDPFEAKQNRLHFWVYDTNYDDNHGAFHVEVIHKD